MKICEKKMKTIFFYYYLVTTEYQLPNMMECKDKQKKDTLLYDLKWEMNFGKMKVCRGQVFDLT